MWPIFLFLRRLGRLARGLSPLELVSLDVTLGAAGTGLALALASAVALAMASSALAMTALELSSESRPWLDALEALKLGEPGASSQTELVRLLALLLGVALKQLALTPCVAGRASSCRNNSSAGVSGGRRAESAAAWEIMVLVVKPEVSGKPEIASAPMMPQIVVSGIVRNRPPRSVHLVLPVRYTTTPALMNKRAL